MLKLVRNGIINIHLSLMIFIRMHSQESQFHNKCLICLIKFTIYVQSPTVCAFGKQIQTHALMWNAHDQRVALCQTPDSFSTHSASLNSRSLKPVSKDGWHLVEALGSATWPITHCVFDRGWVENRPTSDFPLPVWIFSQVVACHMSSVILTDIIQTVLETSECFLSKCE